MAKAHFYVYELVDENGAVQYVGKGCNYRLSHQRSKFKLDGREVARFWKEKHAYAYEVQRIAECKPPLNKHPGGNGSKATPPRKPYYRPDAYYKFMDQMGTRRYAAGLVLGFSKRLGIAIEPSKLERIRQVWYGPRL